MSAASSCRGHFSPFKHQSLLLGLVDLGDLIQDSTWRFAHEDEFEPSIDFVDKLSFVQLKLLLYLKKRVFFVSDKLKIIQYLDLLLSKFGRLSAVLCMESHKLIHILYGFADLYGSLESLDYHELLQVVCLGEQKHKSSH